MSTAGFYVADKPAGGTFGELVEGVLEEQGRSKGWLGGKLDMPRTTLWRFLQNDDVSLGDVELVAGVLGVSPDRLISPSQLERFRRRKEPAPPDLPPVMMGLPRRVRVWIQEFLLEITKAGATEHELDAARRLLTSPDLQIIWRGGEPRDLSEDEWLQVLELGATHIRQVMKKRGRRARA